jgi:hypothetical protein
VDVIHLLGEERKKPKKILTEGEDADHSDKASKVEEEAKTKYMTDKMKSAQYAVLAAMASLGKEKDRAEADRDVAIDNSVAAAAFLFKSKIKKSASNAAGDDSPLTSAPPSPKNTTKKSLRKAVSFADEFGGMLKRSFSRLSLDGDSVNGRDLGEANSAGNDGANSSGEHGEANELSEQKEDPLQSNELGNASSGDAGSASPPGAAAGELGEDEVLPVDENGDEQEDEMNGPSTNFASSASADNATIANSKIKNKPKAKTSPPTERFDMMQTYPIMAKKKGRVVPTDDEHRVVTALQTVRKLHRLKQKRSAGDLHKYEVAKGMSGDESEEEEDEEEDDDDEGGVELSQGNIEALLTIRHLREKRLREMQAAAAAGGGADGGGRGLGGEVRDGTGEASSAAAIEPTSDPASSGSGKGQVKKGAAKAKERSKGKENTKGKTST